jgi:hypothetical protein
MGEIMAAEYRTGACTFAASKPSPTGVRAANLATAMSCDIALKASASSSSAPISATKAPIRVTFLLNFFDDRKQRVH